MRDIRIRRTAGLDAEQRRLLYELHAGHFDNSEEARFYEDFDEKDYVLTAKDSGAYVAFSTIKLHDELVDGRRTVFVFSGDTIVRPEYWSSNLLAPAFAAFLGRTIQSFEGVGLYWFLITKGYRTYMFLPVYFETYYPRPDAPTPPEYRTLVDYIARKRYGERYDAAKGIISFGGACDYLNKELSRVPEARREGKHISYFLSRNPGYARGDELACIAKIERSNLKPRGRKLLDFDGLRWEL